MVVKYVFYGVLSIIGLVTSIAALGSIQQLMTQTLQNVVGVKIDNTTASTVNTFCTKDSDCKPNPKNCAQCVNILEGGFTLLSKCDVSPCTCIENRCRGR